MQEKPGSLGAATPARETWENEANWRQTTAQRKEPNGKPPQRHRPRQKAESGDKEEDLHVPKSVGVGHEKDRELGTSGENSNP